MGERDTLPFYELRFAPDLPYAGCQSRWLEYVLMLPIGEPRDEADLFGAFEEDAA
jgi:hypothetical protein